MIAMDNGYGLNVVLDEDEIEVIGKSLNLVTLTVPRPLKKQKS